VNTGRSKDTETQKTNFSEILFMKLSLHYNHSKTRHTAPGHEKLHQQQRHTIPPLTKHQKHKNQQRKNLKKVTSQKKKWLSGINTKQTLRRQRTNTVNIARTKKYGLGA
jgi:hypothetical protein